MKCKYCQQDNRDDNFYCTSCGEKLVKDKVVCASCGAENSEEANYCVSCGQKLALEEFSDSKKCASCGAENPKENLYCVACGAKLYNQKTTEVNVDGNVSYLDYSKKAQNSLVLGIIAASVSIVCCCVPFVAQIVGIVLAIIAIINGVKGLQSDDKTKAIIGMVLSVIAIFLSIYMIVEYVVTLSMLASMTEEELRAWFEQADFAVIKNYIKGLFIK